MTRVAIGGVDFDVPPLNFKSLKKAWPFIVAAQGSVNPVEITSAAITVLSSAIRRVPAAKQALIKFRAEEAEAQNGIALDEGEKPAQQMSYLDWIESSLLVTEIEPLGEFLQQMLEDSGLVAEKKDQPLGEE